MDVTRLYILLSSLMCYVYAGVGWDDPLIIWTQRAFRWSKVKGISMDNKGNWTKLAHMKYVQSSGVWDTYKYAISYNYLNDELLWSDILYGQIFRQTLNHTLSDRNDTMRPVFSTDGQLMINGIASDWLTGALYFTESRQGWIGVVGASTELDNFRVLYSSREVNDPHDIAVDPIEGQLFWSETLVPRIMTAPTAGGEAFPLVTTGLDTPLGVTVDAATKTLFWVDRGRGMLESVKYDGASTSERTALFPQPPADTFFSLAFADGLLFITTDESLHLFIVDSKTGKQEHYLDVDAFAYDIISTSPPPLTTRTHECMRLGCQHICMNHGGFTGSCVCRDGFFLNPDGFTCSPGSTPQYIYSIGHSILSVNVTLDPATQLISRTPATVLVQGIETSAPSLAVHVAGRLLFFGSGQEGDGSDGAIYWEQLGNEEAEWSTHTEITVQIGDIQGLAVDWLSNTLFWSDALLGHIMMSQLDGRYHSLLLSLGDQPARGLAVTPGALLWVSEERVERLGFGEMDRKVLLEGMFEGRCVAVDTRMQRVYVTDAKDSAIHMMDMDGGNHQKLDMRAPGMYGIAPFQDMLTWSQDALGLQHSPVGEEAVYALSNTSSYPHLNPSHATEYYDVLTYGDYAQPNVVSACGRENGGCAQLCFPVGSENRTCSCAIGYKLAEDGSSCTTEIVRGEALLFVDPYHKQIYQVSVNGTNNPPHAVPQSPDSLSGYPVSMDYRNGKLFWVDHASRQIVQGSMEGGEMEVLATYEDEYQPVKLVAAEGSVYYLDAVNSTIVRLPIDQTDPNNDHSSSRRRRRGVQFAGEVVLENVYQPRALVVDSEESMLYWSSVSAHDGSGQIERMRQDGTDRAVLSTGHGDITGLYLHTQDMRLYWCDGLKGHLGYVNLNQSQPSTTYLSENVGVKYTGISVGQNGDIYVTVWNSKGIMRMRKGQKEEYVVTPVFARIMDMKLFSELHPLAVVAPPTDTLVPVWISIAVLGLLFLLIFAILLALWQYKRRSHSSKDTTSSNEPINDLDNEVEWLDFENPSMYDNRALNEGVEHDGVGNMNASNGNLNPPLPGGISVATVSSGMVGAPDSSDAVSQHESIHSMHSSGDGSVRFSQQAPSARTSRDSRVLSGAAATAISMIGRRSMSKKSEGKRSARFKKNSSKKAPPAPPIHKHSMATIFKVRDNQKVATVLNRVIGKLRKDIRNVEHWTETGDSGVQQAPPDITINMPITSSNTSISSEKGLKTVPGHRLVYIPPKLHDPPRGWAPASHNVPRGGIKSSWGKAKNMQMRNAMKAQEIPMETDSQNGHAGETV